jgi:sugar lactone lactonase YvrE
MLRLQMTYLMMSVVVPSIALAANPIVPDDAKLEKLFTRSSGINGGLTEGPTSAPDGSIYFSDIPFGEDKGQILRFDPKTGKTTVFSNDSRKSNGLKFDADGHLVACEGADLGGRAIARYDIKTGKRTVVADSYQGKRFNAPNDLVFDAQGRIYFSDPRYLGAEPRELEHRAVYRIDTDGTVVEVTHEVEKPNGVALSPDQKTLFVADHNNGTDRIGVEEGTPGAMKIYSFPLGPDGLVNGPRKTLQDYGAQAGCDGMTIDRAGNVYLTLRSIKKPGVRVINAAGKELAFIPTGPENQNADDDPVGLPSNVTFGTGDDSHTLYVTIDKSLFKIRLKSEGFPVPFFDETTDHNWQRITLDVAFRSEGVAVGDLNNDGRNDVVAGDIWYEAPKQPLTGEWKRHEIRKPGQYVAGIGYSHSFCNYVWDVDQDGQQDVVIVGFPGEPFHWYRNPGSAGGHWKGHEIWHSICNESPDFADITGDGKPEFVFGSQPERRMGFSPLPSKDAVANKWTFHAISKSGDPGKNGTFKYYHGLGHGDLNQDKRTDVLIAHGWWEQPADLDAAEWEFHPYALGRDGVGVERMGDIHVDDLDLDGDQDLIASSAHAHGVWWWENLGDKSNTQFRFHLIDQSYSQTHAMEYVDINGDGQRDIVTGKRFFAHNGGDPGGRDLVQMFWYEVHRGSEGPRFIRHEIAAARNTGIGTQFQVVDFNGDGKADIALSNKKGVNLLLQK